MEVHNSKTRFFPSWVKFYFYSISENLCMTKFTSFHFRVPFSTRCPNFLRNRLQLGYFSVGEISFQWRLMLNFCGYINGSQPLVHGPVRSTWFFRRSAEYLLFTHCNLFVSYKTHSVFGQFLINETGISPLTFDYVFIEDVIICNAVSVIQRKKKDWLNYVAILLCSQDIKESLSQFWKALLLRIESFTYRSKREQTSSTK